MDCNRVAGLVDALTLTFEAGVAFYTKWKKRQERDNHYLRPAQKSSPAVSTCSLTTSLDISCYRIRAAYQAGFELIGPDFAIGDTICRDCLWTNLSQLGDCIELLRRRVLSRHPGPLNLYDIIHVSEATSHQCITALAEQYRRHTSGRAIPQELAVPGLRSASQQAGSTVRKESPAWNQPSKECKQVEFDSQTATWSTASSPPVFQSEPPSPPLTPRLEPDEGTSLASAPLSHRLSSAPTDSSHPTITTATTHNRVSRGPNNSVFSIFCPEALALQVDPSLPLPSTMSACRCGHRWECLPTGDGAEESTLLLRDGFRLKRRFLWKSHCDGKAEGGRQGYGCVLCTSSGRTAVYDTAEMLRVHVNAAHTKWQMLHDRDLV